MESRALIPSGANASRRWPTKNHASDSLVLLQTRVAIAILGLMRSILAAAARTITEFLGLTKEQHHGGRLLAREAGARKPVRWIVTNERSRRSFCR